MLSKFKLNQLYFKDTQFANLMTRRIFNVLLIANPYDALCWRMTGVSMKRFSMNIPHFLSVIPPVFTSFHRRRGVEAA